MKRRGPGSGPGAEEIGALVGYLVSTTAFTSLAGLPLLNPATVAGFVATTIGLAFHRAVGTRGTIGGLPLFVAVYAFAEAREGRTVLSPAFLPLLVVYPVVLLSVLAARSMRGKNPVPVPRTREDLLSIAPFLLIVLLGLLGLYSGASGGAGKMSPWFGWLPERIAWDVIVGIRKTIHSTFYPLLALTALATFGRVRPDLRANAPWALTFAAVFAVFDEVRQSQAPGRNGSPWDVLLDVSAATVVLAIVVLLSIRRSRSLETEAPQ